MEHSLALFTALLLVAEVLGTIGGFGSSMLVMPLAGWFLPFDQALGLTALFHVFSNAAKMLLFRTGISWRLLGWLGIPAVIGVLIGARLTVRFDEDHLAFFMGTVLVSLGTIMLLAPRITLNDKPGTAMAGGVVSGLLAGLAGTGGAIRGLTLAAFGLEKTAFVATSAWIDMGVDLGRTVVYSAQGFVTHQIIGYLPIMAVTSVLGSYLGKLVLARLDQRAFRTIVLSLVVIMGAITIWQARSV